MNNAFPPFTILFLSLLTACTTGTVQEEKTSSEDQKFSLPATDNPAEILVREMVDASGGLDKWRSLQDVEYEYIYRDAATGKQDVSLERYVYEGEKSWAKYTERSYRLMPGKEGVILQGHNGKDTWTTLNGELLTDPAVVRRADFLRKTNYYWLNMMYKLLDPGVRYTLKKDQVVDGQRYKIVEITFGENVGDVQDIYILYINPETKLVDQFLFTVMDFGRETPLMMEVQYEELEGLKWPNYRRYTPSDWEGNIEDTPKWTEEVSRNFKFNNGFDLSLFEQ